jgi:hypothetical protein
MHRIAEPSPLLQIGEQLCHERPSLILQASVSQINILLPDRIRFSYPAYFDHNGQPSAQTSVQEIDACVLGENAHGICFLTGVVKTESVADVKTGIQVEALNDVLCVSEAVGTYGATAATTATAAFRMNLIVGAITRVATGEQLPVYAWERRVRRRFAMDCKTDALPLSTMLITTKNGNTDMPD